MNRRKYLSATTSVVVAGILAGCTSGIRNTVRGIRGLREDNTDPNSFRGPVTHSGVEVTPTKWFTTNQITWDVRSIEDGSSVDYTEDSPSGAEYLFTHLTAENVSETPQMLPGRYLQVSNYPGGITVRYHEEAMESLFTLPNSERETVTVSDRSFTLYRAELEDASKESPVYPETSASGWVIHEITAGFDPSETEIAVRWGAESIHERDENREFTWRYDRASKTTPESVS